MNLPLLSIAIPTFNRANFLRLTLDQLLKELPKVHNIESTVEIIVADNNSEDNTRDVVQSFIEKGLSLKYFCNSKNIGSDQNIALCFNVAIGNYVLLLSDDDVLLDGSIEWLLGKLRSDIFGVVYLRQFGYDKNYIDEIPGHTGKESIFYDAGAFLTKLGASSTLISSNVINKKLLHPTDAQKFCGSSLVQMHLIYRAALKADKNLYTSRYLVACKRNNSGGYNFIDVFVNNFCEIIDHYKSWGLSQKDIDNIKDRMLTGYYPYYFYLQLVKQSINSAETKLLFEEKFGKHLKYFLFILPLFKLPRIVSIMWCVTAVIFGRILVGDTRRIYYFLLYRLSHFFRHETIL